MSIDPIELRSLEEQLEHLHERCSEQLLRSGEVQHSLGQIDAQLEHLLPRDSDLYRIYDRARRESTDWWQDTVSGYVALPDCRNIGRRIATVRQLLSRVSPEFLHLTDRVPREFYFAPGEVFRARQRLFQILVMATMDLLVIDQYLDPTMLDFVEALDPKVNARLLAGVSKPLFISQVKQLQVMRPNVEVKFHTGSHDRWIVLDRTEAWHLGASINGLGKSACRISKVADSNERLKVLSDTEAWWSAGTPT